MSAVGAVLVVVLAEVVVASVGVGEQVPDDREDRVADGDDRASLPRRRARSACGGDLSSRLDPRGQPSKACPAERPSPPMEAGTRVLGSLRAAMPVVHRRFWLAPSGGTCVRTSGRADVITQGTYSPDQPGRVGLSSRDQAVAGLCRSGRGKWPDVGSSRRYPAPAADPSWPGVGGAVAYRLASLSGPFSRTGYMRRRYRRSATSVTFGGKRQEIFAAIWPGLSRWRGVGQ